MSKPDVATIAQKAFRLGLLTDAQVREALRSVDRKSPPESLLRFLERKSYLTPWQSQKLLKGDQDGFFLGGYRVLYRIASGSFGRVFRAEDPRNGTVVAIKVLRKRFSDQRKFIELFEREGKVGLSLRHPNIVSVLDVSLDLASKQYYIIMEFVEGGNLRDFLAIRQKLSAGEALQLLDDCASALAYAYSLGITHRDIKPTNILISAQKTAKLVDFGLADICAGDGNGEGDKVDRTVDYAGLEKATGVKRGDVRSDIYFLGCILYEMITGRSPLDQAKSYTARMDKERFLNTPTLQVDEVPDMPGMVRLVDRMMAFQPQQRFQTPGQLVDAIRELREGGNGASFSAAPLSAERTVFLVERNRRLQDALRDALKKLGYRVMLASECSVAVERFRQTPFDAVVLDAGSAGPDGLHAFEEIRHLANRKRHKLAGILILSEDQATWTKMVPHDPRIAVLVRPLTLGKLVEKLQELAPPR